MLNQYGREISIVLATYTPEYVKYLLDGSRPLDNTDLKEEDMLKIYRLNTFTMTDMRHMYALSVLLSAIMITDRGKDIGRGLQLTGSHPLLL